MVNKPTHDSGTIIDHVYVLQTVNTIQTDVTDCYYNDDDCILCLITVELTYITFSWNSGIHMINMILCIQMLVKYCLKCRSTQTSDINVNLALCHILRVVST